MYQLRWFGGPGVLLREDSRTWPWVLARNAAALSGAGRTVPAAGRHRGSLGGDRPVASGSAKSALRSWPASAGPVPPGQH